MGTYKRNVRRHVYLCDSEINVHKAHESDDDSKDEAILSMIPPLNLQNLKDNFDSYFIESSRSSSVTSDAQSIISHLNKIRTKLDSKLSSVRLSYQLSLSNVSITSSARKRSDRISRISSIISTKNIDQIINSLNEYNISQRSQLLSISPVLQSISNTPTDSVNGNKNLSQSPIESIKHKDNKSTAEEREGSSLPEVTTTSCLADSSSPEVHPAVSSPPEVTTAVGLADSSSNYLSLKSRATPGDRGDEEGNDWTSSGIPGSDLRELEGEVNREGATPSGMTSSGEAPLNGKDEDVSSRNYLSNRSIHSNARNIFPETSTLPNDGQNGAVPLDKSQKLHPRLIKSGISRTTLVPNQTQLLNNLKNDTKQESRQVSIITATSSEDGMITFEVPDWIDKMMDLNDSKDVNLIKHLMTLMKDKSISMETSELSIDKSSSPSTNGDDKVVNETVKVRVVDKYGTTLLTHLPSIDFNNIMKSGIRISNIDSNVIVRGIADYTLDFLTQLSKVNEKCVILRRADEFLGINTQNAPKPWFCEPLMEKIKRSNSISQQDYNFYIKSKDTQRSSTDEDHTNADGCKPEVNPVVSSPPEVTTLSSTRRGGSPPEVVLQTASSNYIPVNGKATPRDRGEGDGADGMMSSTGPQVEPAADLREAEGEVNKEADGRTDLKWRAPCNGKDGPQMEADGRNVTSSGGAPCNGKKVIGLLLTLG